MANGSTLIHLSSGGLPWKPQVVHPLPPPANTHAATFSLPPPLRSFQLFQLTAEALWKCNPQKGWAYIVSFYIDGLTESRSPRTALTTSFSSSLFTHHAPHEINITLIEQARQNATL